MNRRSVLVLLCSVSSSQLLIAQGTTPDSVTIVPGPEYETGPFRRAMIGDGYRDLWLTPIRVPVLDPRQFDSVAFSLRPVNAGAVLASTTNPAAELVVAPLLAAAGVAHGDPRLVVVPRKESAGALYILDSRATGMSTDSMLRLAGRVDSRLYLRARLVDMLVGDWDRRPIHWRWHQVDSLWEPIPLDHMRAFQRADGLLPALARQSRPELVVFNDQYPLLALSYHEWNLDRRLLQDLERPAFDSTARALTLAITDSVIRYAVGRMPPEFQVQRGAELIATLAHRRDQLGALADRYYAELALGADVHVPHDSNVVDIMRRRDTIEMHMVSGYARRFSKAETHEIRLYVDGKSDRITIHGGDDGITLRIIANATRPVIVDSGRGRTSIYGPWTPLQRDEGNDCAVRPSVSLGTGAGGSLGLSLTCEHFGFERTPWEYSNTIGVGYRAASGGGVFNYLGQLHPMKSADVVSLRIVAVSSQFDWFYGEGNSIGVGADTAFQNGLHHGEPDFRVRESYVQVTPGLAVPIGSHTTLTVSPYLRYWQTTQLGRFVDSVRPYGVGPFGTVGGMVGAEFDTRDNPGYTTRGFDVQVSGRGVPAVWSAVSPYETLQASVATYLTPPILLLHPTLALRVGGSKVWGDAPFQDLADVGGPVYGGSGFSVRGGLPDRYTGQAAVYNNAQLEIPVTKTRILVPVTVGVLALNDIGRVFVPGQSGTGDSGWHDGVGGGIFLAPSARLATFSLTIVHSQDGNHTYLGFGTGF